MSMELWHKHDGGPYPGDPKDVVHVRWRDGRSLTAKAGELDWGRVTAFKGALDIMEYRIVQPYTAEQPPVQAEQTALKVQAGGSHYKDMPIQPVEYIHANALGYFEGNVVKYISRWRKKGGVQDLEKARHYIDLLIELEARHDKRAA